MNNSFISLKKINKEYSSRELENVRALKDVSLSFPSSGMIFIVGKSGSGKSTLLNIMGGIDTPTEGELVVGGERIDFASEELLNSYRSKVVGFVFQDYNLIDDFSIRDNVRIPLISNGVEVDEDEIDRLLKIVNLYEIQHKTPSSLSGGEKQRAAIIRALAKKPKILLADEPTGNLDGESSRIIFELLKKLSQDMPVVIVTHDARSAYEFADRIIELGDGKVIDDITRSRSYDLAEIRREYEKQLKDMYSRSASAEMDFNIKNVASYKKKKAISLRGAGFIAFSHLKKTIASAVLLVILLSIAIMGVGVVYTSVVFDGAGSLGRMLDKDDHRSVAIAKGEITNSFLIDYHNDTFSYRDYLDYASEYEKVYKVYPYYYAFEKYIDDYDHTNREDVEGGRVKGLVRILGLCELEEEIGDEELKIFFGSKLVAGNYPVKTNERVEILISDILANSIMENGVVFDNGITYPSSTYDALVGKALKIEGVEFMIVGIYSSRYSGKYNLDKDPDSRSKEEDFATQFVSPVAITNKGAIENQAKKNSAFYGSLNLVDEGNFLTRDFSATFLSVDNKKQAVELAEQNSTTIVFSEYYTKYNNSGFSADEIMISYQLYCEIFDKYKFDENGEKLNEFHLLTPESLTDLKLTVKLTEGETREYKVVGIFDNIDGFGGVVAMNSWSFEETVNYSFSMASFIIPTAGHDTDEMIRRFNGNGTVILAPENAEMLLVQKWFSISRDTLILATVVLIFFIMIMMYAIITRSMGENKKNIGILRTFGVTRGDLVKIYLLIDLIYVLSAYLLGSLLYVAGCEIVNLVMGSSIGIPLTLLIVDVNAFWLMLAVAIFSVLLSSAIPIVRYTGTTPDQVIRKKD